MAYKKKKESTKQDVAYKTIKEAIITNRFQPNEMLLENDLCKMLGFSKTPIREAIRRLASEGFVEVLSEKGVFVSSLNLEEFIEIYVLREALEGMAARLCAIKKDDNLLDLLREELDENLRSLENDNATDSVNIDLRFHSIIINGCQNKNLISYCNTTIEHISRYAFTTINDLDRLQASYEQHKAIYEAIAAGDPQKAEDTMRTHIKDVKEYHIKRNFLY